MLQKDSNHGSLSHVFKFLKFFPDLVMYPRLVLITQGIESQPGPATAPDDIFRFEFINPSGVAGEHSTTAEDLAKRDAHCIFFAEHLATPAQISEFKSTIKASNWSAQTSVLDPEKGHQSGGVGGMVRSPFRIFELEPTSRTLKSLISNGRVGMYGCDVGNNTHATVFCIYGWTGGHSCDTAATRTDGIFSPFVRN